MNDYATKKDLENGLQSVREEIRGVAIIAWRIDDKVTFLAEALVSTRDELKRDIHELRAELSNRIALLEEVVRENSRDIRKNSTDIAELRQDVTELRQDVTELRQGVTELRDAVRDLRLRFDRNDGDMEDLRRRVTAVQNAILEQKKKS